MSADQELAHTGAGLSLAGIAAALMAIGGLWKYLAVRGAKKRTAN